MGREGGWALSRSRRKETLGATSYHEANDLKLKLKVRIYSQHMQAHDRDYAKGWGEDA